MQPLTGPLSRSYDSTHIVKHSRPKRLLVIAGCTTRVGPTYGTSASEPIVCWVTPGGVTAEDELSSFPEAGSERA